jgi:hypothetical protein
LYEAYKKTGLTLEEFEGPKYMRIAHIKSLVDEKRLDENLRWKQPVRDAHLEPDGDPDLLRNQKRIN